jgi:NAD(P)-dependent dehydrogenase (short-subunit alcohol dehydrogenase family)
VTAQPITFQGRVAIVTGGGRGLGKAYAREIAARGASVVVHDSGADVRGQGLDPAPAESTVEEIVAAGGRAVACVVDGSTAAGGQQIVDHALDSFGSVDAVVANAGTLIAHPFTEWDTHDFESLLRHHLIGAFHVTRPAFAVMKEKRYGRLVYISSAAGVFGTTNLMGYAAAKTGMLGLMNTAAIEGAEFGISANAVMPMGYTRMAGALLGAEADTPEAQAFLQTLRVDQVAPVVAFLASEQCTCTHTVLSAFSGRVAALRVGVTPGWKSATGEISAEDVLNNLESITAEAGTWVPASMSDEVAYVATQAAQTTT